jgi:hypothetical protein
MKEMGPLNAALANGDHTDHIYVAMDNRHVYAEWLKRGSNILCDGTSKYVVQVIHRDGTLEIYPYSLASLRPDGRRIISLDDVSAMLIWLVAYDMSKID